MHAPTRAHTYTNPTTIINKVSLTPAHVVLYLILNEITNIALWLRMTLLRKQYAATKDRIKSSTLYAYHGVPLNSTDELLWIYVILWLRLE